MCSYYYRIMNYHVKPPCIIIQSNINIFLNNKKLY